MTSETLRQLRGLIARRKRADSVFGIVGVSLIVLSLGVLAALMSDLFIDGSARLLATHEVKPNGNAPGFREVVGTLRRAGDGWTIVPDELVLRDDTHTIDFASFAGKRVAIEGSLSSAGESTLSVDKVVPLAAGEKPTGDVSIVGEVIAGKKQSRLRPEPMRLNASPEKLASLNLEALDGKRVSIDAGRRGRKAAEGIVEAVRIEPLERKSFFASMPSKNASRAGILPAIVGTLLVMIVTMFVAIPLGVAAGVYLEEYAQKNKLTALIEINIANLAGVPSIIWGLAGLSLFIFAIGMERSILAAGMTLGLLVLPIVIISTREAIRAVPGTIREAAIGLGATKWQTTRFHVIPYSMSGILTGSIIAMSRAIGETAPLVCIGAVLYITFLPQSPISREVPPEAKAAYELEKNTNPNAAPPQPEVRVQPLAWMNDKFTVVPMQIFDWVSRPEKEFQENAAAASMVLIVMTLGLNGFAIALRYRLRKRLNW